MSWKIFYAAIPRATYSKQLKRLFCTSKFSIPVLDLSEETCTHYSKSIQQLNEALSTTGMVYLRNHGVDPKLIAKAKSESLKFFKQPLHLKKKYLYGSDMEDFTGHNGYIALGQDRGDYNSPGDQMEAFDVCSLDYCKFPDEEVPQFKETITAIYNEGKRLGLKILDMLGYALSLKDHQYLTRVHSYIGHGCEKNFSSTRLLYYPPLPPSLKIQDEVRLRMHPHVDYGTLTVLFPSEKAGLQVKSNDDEWYDVSMTDDLLLIVGYLIQQWTSDKYRSTLHRVAIPDEDYLKKSYRQSMAVFIHPDADTIVQCLDGSNKYSSFNAREYFLKRIRETFDPRFQN